MRRLLTAVLAVTALVWLPTVTPAPAARAASICTGWASTRVPPTTIRVLRTASGTVQVVDFRTYVEVVMRAEWGTGSAWKASALQAGAMAVKQFGWYYAMHWRGGSATGGCYDVRDDINDQIYDPAGRTTVKADQVAAIQATWTTSATKSNDFILMGYRSGSSVACGADADGYHLYQASSRACANGGMTLDQILHVYFDPGLAIWRAPAMPAAVFLSPTDQGQVTVGASATLVWAEQPGAGTTIASRLVSLLMAAPRNGSCAVDRWMTASPGWQTTAAPPQVVSGLRTGFCYRAVVTLTDSAAATTHWQSGTMLVDPVAPQATFTSPPSGVVTPITGTTMTVSWTETPTAGTHIVSRGLWTEHAVQAAAGSCMGAQWGQRTSTTSGSPVNSTGLARFYCYRYRLVLTDSAGHKSTTVSGMVLGPSA